MKIKVNKQSLNQAFVVSAIMVFLSAPMVMIGIASGFYDNSYLTMITLLIQTIASVVGVYLLLVFRELLRIKLKTNSFDILLNILIIFSLVTVAVSYLDLANLSPLVDLLIYLPIFITFGAIYIFFGIKLSQSKTDLYSLTKIYGILHIVAGICYLSIIFLLFGLIIDFVTSIILTVIFYRASMDPAIND